MSDLNECLRFESMAEESVKTSIEATLMASAIATGWIFLAEKNDNIVGYIRIDFIWPNKVPYLVWMAVAPETRNQGVGELLFNAAKAKLREHGLKRMLTSACRPKIIESYQNKGYKKIGSFTPTGCKEEVFFEISL